MMSDSFSEETWPKKCSCCTKNITEDAWELMSYSGIQRGLPDHGIPDMELRTCSCGSTLAIVVSQDFIE